MQLVYKFKLNSNNDELKSLCVRSNNLYNQANYVIKQELSKNHKLIRYNELDKIMKITKNLDNEINYRLLSNCQTSQQILRLLDKNWFSYFKSLKSYKKDPSKFKGQPRSPSFRKKNSQNILIYTNQNSKIKDNYVILSKILKIYIPQYDKYKERIKNYQQIRILPKNNFYEIEIVYNYEQQNVKLDYEKYGSIDLGVNNLATLVTDKQPFLYNGKICN